MIASVMKIGIAHWRAQIHGLAVGRIQLLEHTRERGRPQGKALRRRDVGHQCDGAQ